jgi:hypothetical protein
VIPAAAGTAPYTSWPRFELRCADVLSVRCDALWRSSNPAELVLLAQLHGASVHGYTPGWYSPQRLALMSAAVTD